MIRSIIKALDILELLSANENKEMGLASIADSLNMDRGTCVNIIKTLRERGYIDQSAPRSGYRMGYKLYHLTGRAIENDTLTKIARADIQELGDRLNEAAFLSVIRNDRRVVLFDTHPDRDIVVRTRLDKAIYPACTGRVILANYTPEHLEQFIARNGLPQQDEWAAVATAANPKGELINALTQIKQNGYATDHDPQGIVGFAAPVFRQGHIVGAVGLFLPAERLTDESAVLSSVLYCARKINSKIEATK